MFTPDTPPPVQDTEKHSFLSFQPGLGIRAVWASLRQLFDVKACQAKVRQDARARDAQYSHPIFYFSPGSWPSEQIACMGDLLFPLPVYHPLGTGIKGSNPGSGRSARSVQTTGSAKWDYYSNLAQVLGACLPGDTTAGTAHVASSLFYYAVYFECYPVGRWSSEHLSGAGNRPHKEPIGRLVGLWRGGHGENLLSFSVPPLLLF